MTIPEFKCPTCNYVFTHTRGMEYCKDECSAVDFNSGYENEGGIVRLIGDIAL